MTEVQLNKPQRTLTRLVLRVMEKKEDIYIKNIPNLKISDVVEVSKSFLPRLPIFGIKLKK